MPFVDHSLYVMTPEFGAASQLEKIDMLDFADTVAINKFERRGAKDALRDVGRQLVRNREAFGKQPDDMPVFGTSAATFNDDGVTALYQHLRDTARRARAAGHRGHAPARRRTPLQRASARSCPPTASATSPRSPRRSAATTPRPIGLAEAARVACSGSTSSQGELARTTRTPAASSDLLDGRPSDAASRGLRPARGWPAVVESYSGDEQVVRVRDKEIRTKLTRESLSGTKIPRVALPRFTDHGELVRFWRSENLPGYFPFTAGVFPFKRDGEDPARMFAGEGDPARTNRRFKLLSATARRPASRPRSTR